MKHIYKAISYLALIVIFQNSAFSAEQAQRFITVSGDAQVRVVPDEVILTLGIETYNAELSLAIEENDERLKKIVDVTSQFDIEERYVQTEYLQILPQKEQEFPYQNIIGFNVRKTVVITLNDTSKFDKVLSGVLAFGANHVHEINFQTTELKKYRVQARSIAILAAKEKASNLAEELGRNIGQPHTINDNGSRWSSGYNRNWNSSFNSFPSMSQNLVQNMNAADSFEANSSIAFGMITVSAQVRVVFELE